jgi:hypothetical protein
MGFNVVTKNPQELPWLQVLRGINAPHTKWEIIARLITCFCMSTSPAKGVKMTTFSAAWTALNQAVFLRNYETYRCTPSLKVGTELILLQIQWSAISWYCYRLVSPESVLEHWATRRRWVENTKEQRVLKEDN